MARETQSDTIVGRMERLPFTSWHWRILGIALISWLAEGIDINLSSATLPSLETEFDLTGGQVGLVGTATTITIVLFLFIAGPLIDRYGKRRVLLVGLLTFAICTVATAFAPSFSMLVALRILAGAGLGLIFTIPYQIIVEMVPARLRGMCVASVGAALNVGYFGNLLAGSFIIPDFGWRPMYFLGALGIIAYVIAWRALPESPRWLAAKGRTEDADRVMSTIENRVARSHGEPLPEPVNTVQVFRNDNVQGTPIRQLFQKPLLWRTIWLWAVVSTLWSIFYLFSTYLPTMLHQQGMEVGESLLTAAVANAVPIPTHLFGSWLLEKVGRKITIISYSIISIAGAVVFAFSDTYALALTGAALGLGFMAAAFTFMKVVSAEQYPTRLRGTGVTFTEGVGRGMAGVVIAYTAGSLIVTEGVATAITLVIVLGIIGLAIYVAFARETQGRVLETINEPYKTGSAQQDELQL